VDPSASKKLKLMLTITNDYCYANNILLLLMLLVNSEYTQFAPSYSGEKYCNFCVVFNVLVGNIPYEATEEQLKEIFCQAGPVASFR